MRKVFGWLFDPYIHVFVIGLFLVRLAAGGGEDDAVGAPRPAAVGAAQEAEGPAWSGYEQLAAKLVSTLHAE